MDPATPAGVEAERAHPMITLIYMVFRDGRRDLLHVVSGAFDAEAWYQARLGALRLLGVVRVEVEKRAAPST
jgi:hypothetical protein